MADYQKMYMTLFNAITDAIGTLQEMQQGTEELHLSAEELATLESTIPDGEEITEQ